MLLDGSVCEDINRSKLISDIIHDVFEVNIQDVSVLSTFETKLLKISDIKPMIHNRLTKEIEKKDNNQQEGRIGPEKVILHRHNPILRKTIHSPDGIQLTSVSTFSSMRTNVCVYGGKWMYEVTLETAGLQQIGWGTIECKFNQELGVGDSEDSYAYDGKRIKKWNLSPYDYGESWSVGDVIGSCIDFNTKSITFYRNGKNLGIAFDNIQINEEGMAYFPSVSMSFGERCQMNYGSFPFQYPVEGYNALQTDGVILYNQANYLTKSTKKLLKHLENINNNNSNNLKDKNNINTEELNKEDILILFGNIFEFYFPLLTNSKSSALNFS